MKKLLLFCLLCSVPSFAQPVVLELFTSQGCSSCPPAEAYLQELAQQEDVIALAYHVDYWDYLGWQDPFASKAFTQRQHAYAAKTGRVYTPELRVNGVASVVGSDRQRVPTAMRQAVPIRPLTVQNNGASWAVHVPKTLLQQQPDIYVLTVTNSTSTKVLRGENGGRVLKEANVVRHMQTVPRAEELQIPRLPLQPDQHAVLLIQSPQYGPILAAARLP